MRPISPNTGHDEIMVAEDQLQYLPLAAAIVPTTDGGREMLMRYTFTPAERERIAEGDDLALTMPMRVFPHCLELWSDGLGRRYAIHTEGA